MGNYHIQGARGVPKNRHPTKDPLKAMVRELRGFLEGLSDPGLLGVHLTPGRYTGKQWRAGSLGHGRSFEFTGVTTTFHPIKHNIVATMDTRLPSLP